MHQKEVHLVVGASSEIGRAIASELARDCQGLLLAGRDLEELQAIANDIQIQHDAEVHCLLWEADPERDEQSLVEASLAVHGRLDGVVLCQGFMADQDAAASDWALAKQMIDVNYTSSVALLNQFANHFQQQGHGYLCGVTSVAGDRGRQSNYIYGSTKAGMTAYLAGLRNRLFKHGVAVITIKPGFVDTSMTWGLINPDSPLCAKPSRLGRDVVRAIRRRRNVAYVPWFWKYIMLIIRLIPEPLFKRLSM